MAALGNEYDREYKCIESKNHKKEMGHLWTAKVNKNKIRETVTKGTQET